MRKEARKKIPEGFIKSTTSCQLSEATKSRKKFEPKSKEFPEEIKSS